MKKTTKSKIILMMLLLTASFNYAQSTYNAVYNIFQAKCTSCHGGGSPSGALNLSGSPAAVYTTIVNANPVNPAALARGDKRIDPGYPHRSFLLRKCQNGLDADNGIVPAEGNPMPDSPNPPLSNKEIELIRQWVYQGAPQTGNVVDTTVINKYYSGKGISYSAPHPLPTDPGSFQVHLGKIFLDTLSEEEYFIKYDLKLPDTVEVNRVELFLPNASHHFIIYKLLPGAASMFANGLRIQNPTTGAGSSTGYNTMVSAFQASRNDSLPVGTAYQWETSTVLDLNHHLFNTNADSIGATDVYFNVYTQPKGTAAHIMYSDLITNTSIYINNDGLDHTFTSASYNSSAPNMWNIWLLSSHTHKYGVDFDIFLRNPGGSTGTQIFEGFYNSTYTFNQGYYDWEHPPVEHFDPLLTMNPRDGLIQRAKYNNTGSAPVYFGLTTHDEMMLYFVQYTLGASLTAGIQTYDDHNAINLNAYPNPYSDNTQISYELKTKTIISIAVYDVLGNKIQTIADNEIQENGTHTYDFNAKKQG
ncbi:MAG: T9SS type A sorting domain-containing protein, partial [Bacteroidia bacterium]